MLIGRQKEAKKLSEIFKKITDQDASHTKFVIVEGEAGSGKTFLIDYFVKEISEGIEYNNVLVGQTFCDSHGGNSIGYLPFFQILENLRSKKYKGSLSKIDNFNEFLGEVAPSWLKLIPVIGTALAETATGIDEVRQEYKSRSSFSPSEQRDADIYYQYLKILEKMSAKNPLIIIIDDVQWIDQESANLLSYLAQHLPQSRKSIMLLIAHRPYEEDTDSHQENHPLYSIFLRLKQKRISETISLSGINQHEFERFLENKYQLSTENGFKKFPKDFREKIFSMTNGNPLFFTELLNNMEEKGEITQAPDGWKLVLSQNQLNDLPNTLEAALEERIFRLESRLKDLLQIASVEGDNFTAQVVSKIQATELTLVLKLLEEQLSQKYKLISETDEKEVAFQKYISIYSFRHGLIREYLYKRLSNSQRRIMHQQVADCLEEIYKENSSTIASLLARHYLAAGDHVKTAKYGLITAQLELQKPAPRQAVWWCRVVLDAISSFPANLRDNRAMVSAMLLQVEGQFQLGNNDSALTELKDLEKLLRSSDDSADIAKFHFWMGEIETRKGDFDSALNNLKQASEIFASRNELDWNSLCLRRIGHIFAIQGYFATASENWQAAINLSKLSENQQIEAIIWTEIAEFAIDEGDIQKSNDASRIALDIFQNTKSRLGEGICLRNMGFADYIQGQLTKSEAFLHRSIDIFHELDDTEQFVWSSNDLIYCLIEKKDFREAFQILNRILPMCIEMNEIGFIPELYISLATIHLEEGRTEEALVSIQKAAEIVSELDGFSWPRVQYTVGKILFLMGMVEDAEKHFSAAFKKSKDSGFKFVLGLSSYHYAYFLNKTDRKETAKLYLDEAKKVFEKLDAKKRLEEVLLLIYEIEGGFS